MTWCHKKTLSQRVTPIQNTMKHGVTDMSQSKIVSELPIYSLWPKNSVPTGVSLVGVILSNGGLTRDRHMGLRARQNPNPKSSRGFLFLFLDFGFSLWGGNLKVKQKVGVNSHDMMSQWRLLNVLIRRGATRWRRCERSRGQRRDDAWSRETDVA